MYINFFTFFSITVYYNIEYSYLCYRVETCMLGFPGGSVSKIIRLQCWRSRFNPWVGKTTWRREWLPTPVFLPGEFHAQRSLMGWWRVGHDSKFVFANPKLLIYSSPHPLLFGNHKFAVYICESVCFVNKSILYTLDLTHKWYDICLWHHLVQYDNL